MFTVMETGAFDYIQPPENILHSCIIALQDDIVFTSTFCTTLLEIIISINPIAFAVDLSNDVLEYLC